MELCGLISDFVLYDVAGLFWVAIVDKLCSVGVSVSFDGVLASALVIIKIIA